MKMVISIFIQMTIQYSLRIVVKNYKNVDKVTATKIRTKNI